MNPIIDVQNVTRSFGNKVALDNVTLRHEEGKVLGLVGENGAGKTTLTKSLLGLLKPDKGTVQMFGMDPVAQPVEVLGRIGYMSEVDVLPGWMRVHELQRYMRGFYPGWDQAYANELCERFQLDRNAKLVTLSKGQKARAGLMATLAYRPDLLLLDEPSSGLDPIVRRDILAAIVRAIAEEGRTVLLSSHNLAEVDRISDRLAMIKDGRLLFCADLDELKAAHHAFTLVLDEWRATPPVFEGLVSVEGEGREWSVVFAGSRSDLDRRSAIVKGVVDDCRPPTIDEIFVAYARPSGSATR